MVDLDLMLAVWFGLTALLAAYVAFTRTPETGVMKWGWLPVTLYTGPVGAALYILSCQAPSSCATKGPLHGPHRPCLRFRQRVPPMPIPTSAVSSVRPPSRVPR